jgi:phage-related protein (TIGR01555 family)
MGTAARLRDGLVNVLTGRGTTADRSTHNSWSFLPLSPDQVENAYRASWLYRKIVNIPAEDMTRAGRDWDAPKDDIAKIEAEEKRLGVWAKVREAMILGRLGGGAILIGLGDDPSEPLPTNFNAGAIQYLTVFSRWQLALGEMITDPIDPLFGQPRYYQISGSSRALRIHPSRVIPFKGLPVPKMRVASWEDIFWGDSVIQAVKEAVDHAEAAASGFAALIDEAKVDVYRLSGLVDQLAHVDGDAKVMTRLAATNTGKSIHRAVVLDQQDEWEQRQLTLAGMRDVIITYDGRVAGAADIPATRLFGKSPDGMNATGDGDSANYFQSIAARQEMDLRPVLEQIDAVLLPSAGVTSADISFAFSPLQVMNEREQAEIENKEADTVTKLVNTGLIPESAIAKAVQNRLIESQRWPGLQTAIEEAEAAGESLPDDDDPNAIQTGGGDPASADGDGGGNGSPAVRRANRGNDQDEA